MALHDGQLARREEGVLELRPEPVRMRWPMDELISADGHDVEAIFSCSVRPMPSQAERRLLQETFLSHRFMLDAADVVAHFAAALRAAAEGVCRRKHADDLLAESGQADLVAAMKTAANKLAFTCGLEVLSPFHVEVRSATLQRQRAEALQRSLAEQRAAGQLEHMQRAAELLRTFEEIRRTTPEVSAGQVLRQIAPGDQGALLQSLLMASGQQAKTAAIWVVAGTSLLRIDPQQRPASAELLALPAGLGPLRSVQSAGDGRLLVGARGGVYHLDPACPAEAIAYADLAVTSQLGFSRAVLWNEGVWASHSEAGIVGWKSGETRSPAFALRPADMNATAARNIQSLDQQRLVFSTNDRLMLLAKSGGGATLAAVPHADVGQEIIAILPEQHRLLVVLKNGVVQIRDAHSLEIVSQDRRSGDVAAAALLPWLGSARLLLATEEGSVACVGLDDDLVTQYVSPYEGLRGVAAARDLVIAITGDRQRIIFWDSWNPRQLAGDMFVTAIARHRAADVDV